MARPEDTVPDPSPEEPDVPRQGLGDRIADPRQERIVQKTLRDMRRRRPDLFAVFKAWLELFALRDSDTQYTHGVYRGFYAEMAGKLAITEPAVAYRLKRAKLWFVKQLQRNQDQDAKNRDAEGGRS